MRAQIGRRAIAAIATSTALAGRPLPAPAWCGAAFPPYAYSLPWFEFSAEKITPVRVVGDKGVETARKLSPLLVLPPPGLTYEFLETLEAITISERRVAFAVLKPAANLATLVDEARAAVASLESPQVHIFAHGTAAPVALALQASIPDQVASIILGSPMSNPADASLPLARDAFATGRPTALLVGGASKAPRVCVDNEIASLKARPVADVTDVLLRDGAVPAFSDPIAAGGGGGGDDDAAAAPSPPPRDLLSSVRARQTPLLLTRGTLDISSEAASTSIVRQVPGAQLITFDGSASLAHVDDRARYNTLLLDWMDGIDGSRSRRAVMMPGSMAPGGSVKS